MSRKIRSSVLALLAAAGTASAQLDSVFADGWLDDGVNPASTLVLTTNNEQQQIEVEVGPQPGEVRVYGIDGIPSGTLFTGVTAIDLTTGRAQDYVEFRVYATVIPSIRVDTGAGNSDVKFIYFLPFSVAPVVSDVEVVGNAANDKVGFEVFNPHWGQGYGTEIADAMTRIALDGFALHRVEALVNPANRRSLRLVKKLGMRREGVRKSCVEGEDGWHDMTVFALTDDDRA